MLCHVRTTQGQWRRVRAYATIGVTRGREQSASILTVRRAHKVEGPLTEGESGGEPRVRPDSPTPVWADLK